MHRSFPQFRSRDRFAQNDGRCADAFVECTVREGGISCGRLEPDLMTGVNECDCRLHGIGQAFRRIFGVDGYYRDVAGPRTRFNCCPYSSSFSRESLVIQVFALFLSICNRLYLISQHAVLRLLTLFEASFYASRVLQFFGSFCSFAVFVLCTDCSIGSKEHFSILVLLHPLRPARLRNGLLANRSTSSKLRHQ